MPSRLTIDRVSQRFGSVLALDEVSLVVEEGSLVALTGPSGSGKTTLLKVVAGLLKPDGGSVRFQPDPLAGRPPAVLVFQDNLLFPHLRVLSNVTFGPRSRGEGRAAAEVRAQRLLDRLGIGDKALAWPGELSAGQQQRVALARALATEPAVLLLDEPFANLDRPLRLDTARFLRELQREQRLTVVLVTHGQEEAFAVADRVAYLRSGRLIQEGPPEEFRSRPADLETARFTGEVNVVTDPQGVVRAFRASEARLVPSSHGEGRVVSSEWTGQGFRVEVSWYQTVVHVFQTQQPPLPGVSVDLEYQPLVFQEPL